MSIVNQMYSFFNCIDTLFWGYAGLFLIGFLGVYLSVKFRFFQILKLKTVVKNFFTAKIIQTRQHVQLIVFIILFLTGNIY